MSRNTGFRYDATFIAGLNQGGLRNAQVLIEVVDGDGAAIVYLSSVENASGDMIFRME